MIETPLQKIFVDKNKNFSKPFGEIRTFGPKKTLDEKH